ncbi:MAG: hypothetical protein K9J42_02435 [Sulfuritalea sp.]|nr:hypothetical protein [Sulfuritalea sp.]
MNISRSNAISMAMIATLIGLALLGQQLSPLLLPKADVSGSAEPGCDLQRQACEGAFAKGGRMRLSITPRPIAFLSPLRVEVSVTGVKPRKVEVDFSGETMNMGYNRRELTAARPTRYVGETSLPVCVTGRMAWVATVIIETDQQRISIPFRFDVGH